MTLSRDQKIGILVTIITIGFAAIAVFYNVRDVVMRMTFPNNTFLPMPNFGDFNWLTSEWHQTYFAGTGYGHVYFPAAYLLIEPFSSLAWTPIFHHHISEALAILLFELLVTGFVFLLAWKFLRSKWPPETLLRAFVCTFMTYPVIFTVATGNFEGLLFISLALFIIFYHSGRTALSLPFLGMAIAMKLFPAVFCILLLADKNYRSLLYVFLWTALLTLIPLLIFSGGLRDGLLPWFQHMQASQDMYFKLMVVERPGNHFGHSLLNAARVILGQTQPLNTSVLRGYMIFSLACFAGIALYIVKFETTFWKRIALLACAMCLLPYTSTDYKLLHFYMPMFYFINQKEGDEYDLLYVILFGVLMIPKSYLTLYHLDFYTTNGIINTGTMLLMLGTIIGTGLRAQILTSDSNSDITDEALRHRSGISDSDVYSEQR